MKRPQLRLLTRYLLASCCLWSVGWLNAQTPEGHGLTSSAPPVVLAQDGAARLPIVIAPDASEQLRKTAAELAGFLQRITGAEFSIVEGRDAAGITLGTLTHFPDPALAEPLAIRDHYDGIEAFVIRTDADRVRLIANTDLGATHAAWRFLELLGCRWFFMTPNWEIVPEARTLTFAHNEESRPDIWSRNIWFDRMAQIPEHRELFQAWGTRNRQGHSLRVRILHRWHALPGELPELFDGHPEYLALVDGKRRGPQFCVTNAGLQAAVTTHAKQFFAQNPEADMVSLDPADTSGWCTCGDCRALGHHSNQPFHLANVVARELRESHPGKFVGLLAYSWYSDPPDFDMEPNVFVQLTRGMNATSMSFDDLFRLWSQRSSNFGMYEYMSYWEMDEGMLPGSRLQESAELASRLRDYAGHQVRSVSAQATNHWGLYGLTYYLAARLMWDASVDVEALTEDFLNQAFGPAAPAMRRYYGRIHGTPRPLAGARLLRQSLDDLEAAVALAAGNPAVLARLDDLRGYLVYCNLGEQVKLAPKEERRARLLEWFTWAYRTRETHMFSWVTFRSTVGSPASREFDEPEWFWRNTVKDAEPRNPWRDDTPITSTELTARLAAIADDLGQMADIRAESFGDDHVLIATGSTEREPRRQIFSTGMDYLVASIEGEPLRMLIEHRPHAVARPDALYELRKEDGELLRSGTLPVGEHDVELPVPGPGVYRFHCHSRGAGYRIVFPAELPVAYVYTQGQRYRTSGYMAPLYFYVPKEQREISWYAYECGTIRITDPDGTVVHEAPSDGSVVTVPVPPEQAGRVWSIGGHTTMRMRSFHFINVPAPLSANPDRIFVPKSVAERDALTLLVP